MSIVGAGLPARIIFVLSLSMLFNIESSYRWIDQMPQEGDKVLIRVVDVSIDKLTPPKRIIRRDREKMKQEYERLKQELQNKQLL